MTLDFSNMYYAKLIEWDTDLYCQSAFCFKCPAVMKETIQYTQRRNKDDHIFAAQKFMLNPNFWAGSLRPLSMDFVCFVKALSEPRSGRGVPQVTARMR